MAALSFQTVLDPEKIRALADTRFTDVRFLDVVDSTNRMLVDLAAAGAAEGLVLVADEQTAGRGRMGRVWEAPPGASLLVSVLLRPEMAPERTALVTLAAGVAAVDACARAAGVRTMLKWPNDVVAKTPEGERKLGGILVEATLRGGHVDAVVVGLGMNLRWGKAMLPELAGVATAFDLLGSTCSRDDLLVAWLSELEGCYRRLLDGGDALVQLYRQRCATIGRPVRVELRDELVEGTATAVTDEGHLELDTAGGRRTIIAGDVVHLRPASS